MSSTKRSAGAHLRHVHLVGERGNAVADSVVGFDFNTDLRARVRSKVVRRVSGDHAQTSSDNVVIARVSSRHRDDRDTSPCAVVDCFLFVVLLRFVFVLLTKGINITINTTVGEVHKINCL